MDDVPSTRRRFLEFAGTGVLTALAGCNTTAPRAGTDSPAPTSTSPPTDAPTTETPPTSAAEETAEPSPYTRVYRQTGDSVVLVRTYDGQGSGFVAAPSHVVTNAHVVDDASTAQVRFPGGRWSSGRIVGTDPHSDLAVVELPASAPDSDALPFAETAAVVGQEVVAIGNPFDLDGSVTAGIVSGVDRWIPAPTGARIPDAIQTDAAVNPGNSGGPLVSLDGRVVAVISSGGGENIAFGISAALAQRVVPALVEDGSYEHSYIGLSLLGVTPDLARVNGLAQPRGVLVTVVDDDGPASGLVRGGAETRVVDGQRVRIGGDVLLSVDGRPLQTTEDLGSYLALETRPGDSVELTLLRDGSERTVTVELGARPS
ncbi:PDZ domain-containing protein [Halobellus sp. Atlit-31R]|nr:PDZ domain-containing protein [Halobellus sp. Atlit-31R]